MECAWVAGGHPVMSAHSDRPRGCPFPGVAGIPEATSIASEWAEGGFAAKSDRAFLVQWVRNQLDWYAIACREDGRAWDRSDMAGWIAEDLRLDQVTDDSAAVSLALCEAAAELNGWPSRA